jgi:Cu+-exporting ATPase
MNEQAHGHGIAGESSTDRQSIDPVCGMKVDAKTPYRYTFEGREFHFCSERCRERFKAVPTQYIKKADTQSSQAMPTATHDHAHHVMGSETSGTRERVGASPAKAGSEEEDGR